MDIKGTVSRLWKKAVAKIWKTKDVVVDVVEENLPDIERDALALAAEAFEAAAHVDWNGDGRIPTAGGVAAAALEHAEGWGRHLVEDACRETGLDPTKVFSALERSGLESAITEIVAHGATADAKLWHSVAYVGVRLAAKYGLAAVPSLSGLRAIVGALYVLRGV